MRPRATRIAAVGGRRVKRIDFDRYAEATEAIALTADGSGDWSGALEAVSALVPGSIGGLMYGSHRRAAPALPGADFHELYNPPPGLIEDYIAYTADEGGDPSSAALMEHGLGTPVIDDLDFLARAFPDYWPAYQDAVYRPHNVHSQVFIASSEAAGPQFIFGIASEGWSKRQSLDAQGVLRRLAPLIRQSLSLRAKLLLAEGKLNAIRSSTDALRTGLVWLDSRGLILETNTAAQMMLTAADGLQVRSRALAALHQADNAAIEQAVRSAAAGTAIRQVAVRRPSGKRSYVVTLMWLGQRRRIGDGIRLVAYVTDPETAAPRVAETAAALLGLTGAEGEVVQLLSEGLDAEAIARSRGSTIATVRSQIGAVLAKAGLSRQVDLVRIVLAAVGDRR
jgi:DNA-binding CsgD family transcriptional regulator